MSKKVEQYRVCDRPHPRDVPAAVMEKLMLNGVRWDLDLCQACSDQLHALMYEWGECGTVTNAKVSVFDQQRRITGPVVVNLDAGKARPERIVLSSEDFAPEDEDRVPPAKPAASILPATASRWMWADHALDRARERDLTADEVLLAAERPQTVRPSKYDQDLRLHTHGDVTAVVDPHEHAIITAYRPTSEEEWRPSEKSAGVK